MRFWLWVNSLWPTVYPKKYAHGFCFAVLCCGYTLTDFPISIRLTSLALWQSNDCPSASKATLMNMDKYFMWIHYERLHNHNKAKHNKTVCIFLGIYCSNTILWHRSGSTLTSSTITWTNVDLPPTSSSGIHSGVVFTWVKISNPKLCFNWVRMMIVNRLWQTACIILVLVEH